MVRGFLFIQKAFFWAAVSERNNSLLPSVIVGLAYLLIGRNDIILAKDI